MVCLHELQCDSVSKSYWFSLEFKLNYICCSLLSFSRKHISVSSSVQWGDDFQEDISAESNNKQTVPMYMEAKGFPVALKSL